VPVQNEVVDGLELPPSATRPCKEDSVEMEDETDGEITRPVLEQVVESVTVPNRLLLVAAEPSRRNKKESGP
jgi:hypothetical protein